LEIHTLTSGLGLSDKLVRGIPYVSVVTRFTR